MDQEAPSPCCLDCQHCKLKAGWYGTTRYFCLQRGKPIDSSTVLFEACERYANWRDPR